MAPKDVVPEEFRCAATGKPLYMPVVTLQGVAYSYAALMEMFTKARGLPVCKVTGESIPFFPNVCPALHHFLLEEYRGVMRGRRQQDEADLLEQFGLQMPAVPDAPEEEGDAGLLEELQCVVSHDLVYQPCVLSSGSVVSAHCVPEGGFQKDPDRLVATALHGQAPRRCPALESVLQARFPQVYEERGARVAAELGGQPAARHASGTWAGYPADALAFWGLGCDGCGIWPIRGSAWSDIDCQDRVGFHLCGDCHKFGYHKRVITGKFNQNRMPKNRMVQMSESEFF